MKTIEVSDEMHAKLIELATEMTTQNMRITKMPHMFQIREQKEVAAYEGCGEEIWVGDEGMTLRDDEEIKDWIMQDIIDNDENISKIVDQDEAKEAAQIVVDEMKSFELLEDYLHSHDDWREVSVIIEPQYKNTFFTAKACQAHIDGNKHHYNEPDVYLNHAWRNPEMELVSELLCNLVGKSNHK